MTPEQRVKTINIIAKERTKKADYIELKNTYEDCIAEALYAYNDEYLLEQLIEISTL
jgi:hypothetical protein